MKKKKKKEAEASTQFPCQKKIGQVQYPSKQKIGQLPIPISYIVENHKKSKIKTKNVLLLPFIL